MAFSNVHYVSIYQTVTSLTYVFVLLAFRPLIMKNGALLLTRCRSLECSRNCRCFYFTEMELKSGDAGHVSFPAGV
ncbi:hypothetical protein CJQ75_22645 [Salmonella enterica subsp. enterica serovar Typhimurium]|nr:hypothetical protein [Salmonella enterica subsp. enterica serovar Typhimurium]